MSDDAGVRFAPDGIGHILTDMTFQVPPHQRSYKWEREEHVRQLFRDVQDAMDDPSGDGYFLGMIVLKKGSKRKDRLEVIDGQQRLATLSIFLAAVRDYFRSQKDSDRADEIQRRYIADRDTRTLEEEARLYLNTEDRRFFDAHVVKGKPLETLKKHTPTSHRRLADAITEAKEQVARLVALGSPDTAGNRLLDWVDFFYDKARVVAIFVPEEQNAYTLFETLNDRGLELSKADLIKNHLFGRSGNKLDEVRQLWTEMTTTLEESANEDSTVDYIRHYWSSRHSHVRTKGLYAAVKAKTHSPSRAYGEAVALRDDAKKYAALSNTDSEIWKEYKDYKDGMKEHVKTLLEVGVSVIRPLALSVLRRFAPKEAATAFHLFVNWSVRFLIVGGHRSESVEVPFAKTAIEVSDGKIGTAPQMAHALASVIPGNDQFRTAFSTATVSKGEIARYYLRAIEDSIAKSPHPEWISQPDTGKVNLEHVLPINPSAAWAIDARDAERLHKRIGNLALLPRTVNSDIGNKGFGDKRKAFSNSSFHFSSWIGSKTKWTETEIDKRQQLLADEAIKTWPLKVW